MSRSRWGTAALVLLVLATAFPFYWAIVSSFTPEARLFQAPSLVPRVLVLDHYRALFTQREFWVPIRNSLIVAGTTTAFCVTVGGLCAYALARLRFRGKAPLLGLILAVACSRRSRGVPALSAASEPSSHQHLSGADSPVPHVRDAAHGVAAGRILPPAAGGARGSGDGGRREPAPRASGDHLPLAIPGLAATAILTFVYSWNEFLFALSFTLGPERQTVPVAIALFRGQYQVPWGQILAAAVVATAPVALLVLAFQRRIVQGLTAGAVKG